ncbi:ROK family protein [Roseibacillus ishigakijimensis]|uniref:ROK family protein n=1 Tax=Roseibacillus ishigakijimensis TaxID=454146 RepID=A0A934VM60_9BACT|nr:ROK family protein [Roseibacillus ishigakijimensis]MBK1833761.1 ROK family protein [Roseibacillus ishigakijimensis]
MILSDPFCDQILDPEFLPAIEFFRAYDQDAARNPFATPVTLALCRPDGLCFHHSFTLLPDEPAFASRTLTFLERTLKFLLWMQGGSRVHFHGPPAFAEKLAAIYHHPRGKRAFDSHFLGKTVFGEAIEFITHSSAEDLPAARDRETSLGGHLDGCRIGFDLGGSDRKAAALIDGEVVHSEEVPWDPYFQSDPEYHLAGIRDSLQSAARHLPRVDAIGGSAAGVYLNNEVRAASLFRGVTDPVLQQDFVRPIFKNLRREWNDVPFEVINDGEVTALAAANSLQAHSILGIAMGTSLAAGYCNPRGGITPWLNELAFSPIDLRPQAPVDEWSGDQGCGVQYFSQQAAARLAPLAGFHFGKMPFPEQLVELQNAVKAGDDRALSVFHTIGHYLGHTIPLYARFYELEHILLLGRVLSGDGGQAIIDTAASTLALHEPELHDRIALHTPDEKMKRHGQAIAAASLPELP